MDPNFGLPLQFPSAFTTVHAPIPVDQRTHEGRYVWEPRLHSLSHASNRGCVESGGNNLPDFSHFVPRRDHPNGHHHMEIPPHYRLSPYMEQVISSLHGSPTLGAPMMTDARVPLSMDYLQQMSMLHQRNLLDVHGALPPMATAVADLGLGLDGSQIGSPKPGVRHGRKRALSSSPYSDFDINSMIRFSPNSLVSFMNGSRSSSASGSYGHLSAGSLSPAMGVSPPAVLPHFHQLHHLMRQGLTSPFLLPPTGGLGQQSLFPGHLHGIGATTKDPLLSGVGEHGTQGITSRTSKTPQMKSTAVESVTDDKDGAADLKDEPGDFVETNCHWTDCDREFPSQEDLVKHICQDHIHSNKKAFVCRWKDCSREEKPFKAQYMLVVHMRRHTGEKPHRCTFEGCLKAYSRLENLKTHLRSHTGEKPYLCEFPGCTKAFSNASDRAKHQNRTHSNEKPYVCKAQGCTKRYTDPSSLRKHVKTVHGPDFYAKKKHKGDKEDGSGDTKNESQTNDKVDNEGFNSYGADGQTTNLLNSGIQSQNPDPSYKNSATGNEANLCPDTVEQLGVDVPISDNCVSTTSALGEVFETEFGWDVEDKVDLENDDPLAAVMCAVTSTGKSNCGAGSGGFFRGRKGGFQLAAKTKGSWFPKFPSAKGLFQRNSCSQAISSQNNYDASAEDIKTKKTYINLSPPQTAHGCFTPQTKLNNLLVRRRQNSASSVSTYYGSMSSDASCKTQLTNGLNSNVTSVTHSTPQSSCDPLSLWGSRRSSDISSLSGMSPRHASHLKALHSEVISTITDQKRILHVDKMACTPEHLCCIEKSEKSPTVPTSVPSSATYAQSNQPQQRIPKSPLTGDTCPVNYQPCRPNSQDIPSSMSSIKQQVSCLSSCNNQSSERNQQLDQDARLEKCAAEMSLDDNRELILPDEMVTYLNQVAEQETFKAKSSDKRYLHEETSISVTPLISNCIECKQDPNECQLFQNSCCKSSKTADRISPAQNHNSYLTDDQTHKNNNYMATTNQSFAQVPPSYQYIKGNKFKIEALQQTCSQMASQCVSSTNGCPQQMWNSQNSQTAQNSFGVAQTQVCVTHNLASNLYCSQQHYPRPPAYQQTHHQYSANNLTVRQQNFRHNHCNYSGPIDLQNPNILPAYCSHPCTQQINQNCHPYQYSSGNSVPCSGSNNSNHRCSPKYTTNQHIISCHSQSNSPHQYNMQPQVQTFDQHQANAVTQSKSKQYLQYHQCTNCTMNQYIQPQCQVRNLPSHSGNWHQNQQCSEYPQQSQHCQMTGLLTPPVSSPLKSASSLENSVSVCNSAKNTVPSLIQNQVALPNNNCLMPHDSNKECQSLSRCGTPHSVVQANEVNVCHNNGTNVPQPATQSPALSTSNMVINDMNSILSSLMEETKYLRLLQ